MMESPDTGKCLRLLPLGCSSLVPSQAGDSASPFMPNASAGILGAGAGGNHGFCKQSDPSLHSSILINRVQTCARHCGLPEKLKLVSALEICNFKVETSSLPKF